MERKQNPVPIDVGLMPPAMTLDLLATLNVVDDDVAAVVEVYMANPDIGLVGFGEGYRINPAEAVAAHPFARTLIAQPWAGEDLRRAAVRAAILLARPEETTTQD